MRSMKRLLFFIFFSMSLVGGSLLWSDPEPPSTENNDNQDEESESREHRPVTDSDVANYRSRKRYNREAYRKLSSPFRDLVLVEKNEIAKRKEMARKQDEQKKAQSALDKLKIRVKQTEPKKGETTKDKLARQHDILKTVKSSMKSVDELVKGRNYDKALSLLTHMDINLDKNDIQEYRDVIKKKRTAVAQEQKDWEEINKIISSLNIQAMFVTKGKKIALINGNAVEVGDDLNYELSLNKKDAVILSSVSSNSIKLTYKSFVLKKDILEKDY